MTSLRLASGHVIVDDDLRVVWRGDDGARGIVAGTRGLRARTMNDNNVTHQQK